MWVGALGIRARVAGSTALRYLTAIALMLLIAAPLSCRSALSKGSGNGFPNVHRRIWDVVFTGHGNSQTWTQVPLLSARYSLVFRNYWGGGLSVLETDSEAPRFVSTTAQRALCGTPVWSKDGRHLFDCETQVISIAADTGEVRTLTSIPVSKGG